MVQRLGRMACFWSKAQGWAPPETAEYLAEANLADLPPIAETIGLLIDDGLDHRGNLLLAWVALGSLAETCLKWFLSVYLDDYRQDSAAVRGRKDVLLLPHGVQLERLKHFFAKRLEHVYDDHADTIDLIQKRRNCIHVFGKGELGTPQEFERALQGFVALLDELDGCVPYP